MKDHTSIKIFPRNLTACASYIVPGNPAISRPESGVEVSFPGLEIDQRALEQRFFPGLYFEFQRPDGAILADVQLMKNQLESGLSKSDISPLRPIFLLGILCKTQPEDKRPTFFSFFRLAGSDVGLQIRDLMPGRVAIIFGPSWEVAMGDSPFNLHTRLQQLEKAFNAVQDAEKFFVERDNNGQIVYGVFSDNRTAYLNDYGVIDPDIFPPGDLTKTLCAPWIYDFRDCLCFYWASNKPDITDGTTPPFLNYLRDRKNPNPDPPTANYRDWVKQRMSIGKLVSGGWRTLPAVINDREERRALVTATQKPGTLSTNPFTALDPEFNHEDIVNELRYLATVEHALIVEYLFAHYSLDAPLSLDGKKLNDEQQLVFSAASDLLKIAIDEMSHFLWVNELLRVLGEKKPSTDRAKVLGLTPPEPDEKFHRKRLRNFKYLDLELSLRPLSLKVLEDFITIEANSRSTSPNATSFGMYVQILASLMQGDSKLKNVEPAVRLVKLLIDEGDQHGVTFQLMKERLQSIKNFERTVSKDKPDVPIIVGLRKLADIYYHNLLELIHVSYSLREKAGGDLIRKAVVLMTKMHEVGHRLASKNFGLLFPEPPEFVVPPNIEEALKTLDRSEERLMAQLAVVEKLDDQSKDMAARHTQESKRLYQRMRKTIEDDKQ
jgi:Ferritin-like